MSNNVLVTTAQLITLCLRINDSFAALSLWYNSYTMLSFCWSYELSNICSCSL